MCFAYLPMSLTQLGSRVEVEMLGSRFPAVVAKQPLFDPEPIRRKIDWKENSGISASG